MHAAYGGVIPGLGGAGELGPLVDEADLEAGGRAEAAPTQPGIVGQRPAGEGGAVEAAKVAGNARVLRKGPDAADGVGQVLEPLPHGAAGAVLDGVAARGGEAGQVV